VLLDVKMPGKSGLDVLRELKARDIDAAVVMVSGMGDTPTAVACMTSGATDYIVKPFTTEELLRRVNGALEKRILVRQNRDYQKTLEQRVGEQTSHLEQKVRELTALNGLFQAYLAQRDETEVAFDELADQILMIAEEVRAHARKIESRRAEIRALMQGKTAS
jgi:FixJ family two-component response regulator